MRVNLIALVAGFALCVTACSTTLPPLTLTVPVLIGPVDRIGGSPDDAFAGEIVCWVESKDIDIPKDLDRDRRVLAAMNFGSAGIFLITQSDSPLDEELSWEVGGAPNRFAVVRSLEAAKISALEGTRCLIRIDGRQFEEILGLLRPPVAIFAVDVSVEREPSATRAHSHESQRFQCPDSPSQPGRQGEADDLEPSFIG